MLLLIQPVPVVAILGPIIHETAFISCSSGITHARTLLMMLILWKELHHLAALIDEAWGSTELLVFSAYANNFLYV